MTRHSYYLNVSEVSVPLLIPIPFHPLFAKRPCFKSPQALLDWFFNPADLVHSIPTLTALDLAAATSLVTVHLPSLVDLRVFLSEKSHVTFMLAHASQLTRLVLSDFKYSTQTKTWNMLADKPFPRLQDLSLWRPSELGLTRALCCFTTVANVRLKYARGSFLPSPLWHVVTDLTIIKQDPTEEWTKHSHYFTRVRLELVEGAHRYLDEKRDLNDIVNSARNACPRAAFTARAVLDSSTYTCQLANQVAHEF